jgi:hypothetical protein
MDKPCRRPGSPARRCFPLGAAQDAVLGHPASEKQYVTERKYIRKNITYCCFINISISGIIISVVLRSTATLSSIFIQFKIHLASMSKAQNYYQN